MKGSVRPFDSIQDLVKCDARLVCVQEGNQVCWGDDTFTGVDAAQRVIQRMHFSQPAWLV